MAERTRESDTVFGGDSSERVSTFATEPNIRLIILINSLSSRKLFVLADHWLTMSQINIHNTRYTIPNRAIVDGVGVLIELDII